jgi:hypothetical protein
MQKQNIRLLTLTAIIFGAAFSRIVPHMPNFSPMDTITLFAAAHFARKWQAFLIPFAAMWLSSLFIDNVIYAAYNPKFVWIYPGFHWQYLGYFLIALLGLAVFRKGISVLKVLGAGLTAGGIFFLVSNFGVWAQGGLYPQTWEGLVQCYAAAVPFYRGTLLGDVFYGTVLFGGFFLLTRGFPSLQKDAERFS